MFVVLLRFSGNKSAAGQHISGHEEWIIATAVCEALCGPAPIITAAMTGPLLPVPGEDPWRARPIPKTLTGARASFEPRHGEAPAGRHVVRKPGHNQAGRRFESQSTGTSQRYDAAHCHPGQARTVYTKSQSDGSCALVSVTAITQRSRVSSVKAWDSAIRDLRCLEAAARVQTWLP